jgi:hypothetical protein
MAADNGLKPPAIRLYGVQQAVIGLCREFAGPLSALVLFAQALLPPQRYISHGAQCLTALVAMPMAANG